MSEFLTVKELAEFANISTKFIYEHARLNQIPGSVKFGRTYRFRKSEIEKNLLKGKILIQ